MADGLYKPLPRVADYAQDDTLPRLNLGLRPALLLILLGGLVMLFLLSLALGSVSIPPDQILDVLMGGQAESVAWTNIILKIRLPKALTAILAGAALGVSGLMMQTFFRNPLADPFVLGISSGASLGVALVVMAAGTVGGALLVGFGLSGDLVVILAAGMGAALTLVIVFVAASRVQSSMTLLILGLMMGYIVSALVSLILYFAIPERIQAYVSWTFGSFGGVTWQQIPLLAGAVVIGLAGALLLTKSLNALLLSESYARSMGLNVGRVRLAIVTCTALMTGAVTTFCGPIAFLGIAVPHVARGVLRTSDHRLLVPATMLIGALTALAAALIAEVPGHTLILPLNAVTALIGAPIVVWVILRQRSLQRTFAA